MRSFLLSLMTHAQVWLEPCAQCRGDGSRPRGAPAYRVRGGSQVSFFRRKKILSFLLCSELVNKLLVNNNAFFWFSPWEATRILTKESCNILWTIEIPMHYV
jgi:hypothetical protein